MNDTTEITEREAFEAWYRKEFSVPNEVTFIFDRDESGDYLTPLAYKSWLAWQARGAQPASVAVPSAEQLTDALRSVSAFHEMSEELIAPQMHAFLLGGVEVPDGYALVPIEPTAEMRNAHDAAVTCYSATDSIVGYQAMLAAAPAFNSGKIARAGCDVLRHQLAEAHALLLEARKMTIAYDNGKSGVLRGQIDALLFTIQPEVPGHE